jgi:hypothetical protein
MNLSVLAPEPPWRGPGRQTGALQPRAQSAIQEIQPVLVV